MNIFSMKRILFLSTFPLFHFYIVINVNADDMLLRNVLPSGKEVLLYENGDLNLKGHVFSNCSTSRWRVRPRGDDFKTKLANGEEVSFCQGHVFLIKRICKSRWIKMDWEKFSWK